VRRWRVRLRKTVDAEQLPPVEMSVCPQQAIGVVSDLAAVKHAIPFPQTEQPVTFNEKFFK